MLIIILKFSILKKQLYISCFILYNQNNSLYEQFWIIFRKFPLRPNHRLSKFPLLHQQFPLKSKISSQIIWQSAMFLDVGAGMVLLTAP